MSLGGTRIVFALTVLACVGGPGAHTVAAQDPATGQPCTTSPQPQPCSAGSTKPAAERFPFPGEGPGTGSDSNTTPSATTSTNAPTPAADRATHPAGSPDQPADKRFPFPGAGGASSAAPSSSSSSADPTAFPADDTNTPDPNAPDSKDKATAPEGRRLLKRVNPIGTKLQSADEREAEDLSVARFYTDQGNLQAAYLRAQDAVKTIPDDPDAHCALAEAALRLNKRDEAVGQFNACLKLDPTEKVAKSARRELARLQ